MLMPRLIPLLLASVFVTVQASNKEVPLVISDSDDAQTTGQQNTQKRSPADAIIDLTRERHEHEPAPKRQTKKQRTDQLVDAVQSVPSQANVHKINELLEKRAKDSNLLAETLHRLWHIETCATPNAETVLQLSRQTKLARDYEVALLQTVKDLFTARHDPTTPEEAVAKFKETLKSRWREQTHYAKLASRTGNLLRDLAPTPPSMAPAPTPGPMGDITPNFASTLESTTSKSALPQTAFKLPGLLPVTTPKPIAETIATQDHTQGIAASPLTQATPVTLSLSQLNSAAAQKTPQEPSNALLDFILQNIRRNASLTHSTPTLSPPQTNVINDSQVNIVTNHITYQLAASEENDPSESSSDEADSLGRLNLPSQPGAVRAFILSVQRSDRPYLPDLLTDPEDNRYLLALCLRWAMDTAGLTLQRCLSLQDSSETAKHTRDNLQRSYQKKKKKARYIYTLLDEFELIAHQKRNSNFQSTKFEEFWKSFEKQQLEMYAAKGQPLPKKPTHSNKESRSVNFIKTWRAVDDFITNGKTQTLQEEIARKNFELARTLVRAWAFDALLQSSGPDATMQEKAELLHTQSRNLQYKLLIFSTRLHAMGTDPSRSTDPVAAAEQDAAQFLQKAQDLWSQLQKVYSYKEISTQNITDDIKKVFPTNRLTLATSKAPKPMGPKKVTPVADYKHPMYFKNKAQYILRRLPKLTNNKARDTELLTQCIQRHEFSLRKTLYEGWNRNANQVGRDSVDMLSKPKKSFYAMKNILITFYQALHEVDHTVTDAESAAHATKKYNEFCKACFNTWKKMEPDQSPPELESYESTEEESESSDEESTLEVIEPTPASRDKPLSREDHSAERTTRSTRRPLFLTGQPQETPASPEHNTGKEEEESENEVAPQRAKVGPVDAIEISDSESERTSYPAHFLTESQVVRDLLPKLPTSASEQLVILNQHIKSLSGEFSETIQSIDSFSENAPDDSEDEEMAMHLKNLKAKKSTYKKALLALFDMVALIKGKPVHTTNPLFIPKRHELDPKGRLSRLETKARRACLKNAVNADLETQAPETMEKN